MNIEVNLHSAVAQILGSVTELDTVEDILFSWARQLVPGKQEPMSAHIRRTPYRIEVMLGACIAAGLVAAPAAQETVLTAAQVSVAAMESSNYLRPYQAAAVMAAVRSVRGIVHVPTAGGKTRICCALAKAIPGQWLYLVQNQELARQTAIEAPSNLLCRSYGTVSALELTNLTGLIVDECHLVAAAQRASVVTSCSALWRIGLSGTPLQRSDARNSLVCGLLGPVIFAIKMHELEDTGSIAKGSVKNLLV